MEEMKLIDFVKQYRDLGWSIIPILPETKKPPIKWGQFLFENKIGNTLVKNEGFTRPGLDMIQGWLNKGYWLAVITGPESGVLVVDDDRIKHGLEEWGFTSPLVALSQSGGKHYYFKYDREIHSHVNGTIRVDLKAWHSYALLPPFNNRKWLSNLQAGVKKLEPIPDEIVRLINSDKKLNSTGYQEPLRLEDFMDIPEGSREDDLYRIACSIFTKETRDAGTRILYGVNQTYKPPIEAERFEYQVSRAWQFTQDNPLEGRKNVSNGTVDISSVIPKPRKARDIISQRREEWKLEEKAASTGYPELDEKVFGFVPKHFYTLTGITNVGKTAIACNFACNVARQGRKVLYIALEPDTSVLDVFATITLGKKFRRPPWTGKDMITEEDLERGVPEGIEIFTREVRTFSKLKEVLKNSSRYDLVVIDHIGYFSTEKGDDENYVQQLSELIRNIVGLTKDSLTAILAVAHLNREGSKKKNPGLFDIKNSSAFEQDSTDVWIVTRFIDPDDENVLMDSGLLIVAKGKPGNASVRLNFRTDSALITTAMSEKIRYEESNFEKTEEIVDDTDNPFLDSTDDRTTQTDREEMPKDFTLEEELK